MTANRIIVPGATTAITRRTTFRKAFLAPWDPVVKDVWLYSLAYAQSKTQVDVHLSNLVVNHHHTAVTPRYDNLPEFCLSLHRDTSKALNALLAKHKYDAPRDIFDKREPHYMRLLDAEAQASHLVYHAVNCVAAGLVDSPELMPDHLFDFTMWKRGKLTVRRPEVYFSSDRPAELELRITPPPLLYRQFGGDIDRLIYRMQSLTEDAVKTIRKIRKRKPLGAQGARHLHPWSEPSTLRERGGERVPTFRIGARGVRGIELNVQAAREVRAFRDAYREVRIARRDGDLEKHFPYGTYAQRAIHNSPACSTPIGELVTAPGPLLDDVREELGGRHVANVDETTRLGEAVREALREELVELADEEEMDFAATRVGTVPRPNSAENLRESGADNHRASESPNDASENTSDDDRVAGGDAARDDDRVPERDRARVSRRFDKKPTKGRHAAREVVLRDERRGRPAGKRSGDPPG